MPADGDAARQTRLRDRFFDLYVNTPCKRSSATACVRRTRKTLRRRSIKKQVARQPYGMLDQELGTKTWVMGENFTMADCAAAPALFYANMVAPFMDSA